jgi:diadenosine tetraphosphate (Ap4A) HIT family hydrolase
MCAATRPGQAVPWTDVPILTEPGAGVVIPATGAIVPGYVLVCPEEHLLSLARLPEAAKVGFAHLVRSARVLLERTFGPTLMFEHGGCDGSTRRSQCVAHAHLHLWAIADSCRLTVPSSTATYNSLDAFLGDAAKWANAPYLLYSDGDERIYVSEDHGEAQYFRRQISATLGRPYEWDYGAFIFADQVQETIERLRRSLAGAE